MNSAQFEDFLDDFNRLAKLGLDTGEANDPETAVAQLQAYAVHIAVGPEIVHSVAHQIALLTLVNVAGRFALGGVTISMDIDAPVLAPWPGKSVAEALRALGGTLGTPTAGVPVALIGSDIDERYPTAIRVTFEGWRGGIVAAAPRKLSDNGAIAPAAVLAAAMAAAELFAILRGEASAGNRELGLSLWNPDGGSDWRAPASDGPPLERLPNHLWILGLGHLGQAFLWTVAMCPYADPSKVRFVLQDTDIVTGSTKSTSILTTTGTKRRKTRVVAEILDSLGFQTTILERVFDDAFTRRVDDPSILVCGVDNALARRQLEAPGFPIIVEAGIGRTAQDFRAIRLHTFPAKRKAAELWRKLKDASPVMVEQVPDYKSLKERGLDPCGVARLADTAVGAPFVGAVAGALMLAQILRILHGGVLDAVVDLDLLAMSARRAVKNNVASPLNPGFQSLSRLAAR